MRTPTLELLWWEGCPSTERALADLRAALSELGLGEAEISMREIHSDEEAVGAQFTGSPTILIDGVELMALVGRQKVSRPSDEQLTDEQLTDEQLTDEQPAGLNCRVYRRRDGRVSPTPDPLDLRAALAAAREREE